MPKPTRSVPRPRRSSSARPAPGARSVLLTIAASLSALVHCGPLDGDEDTERAESALEAAESGVSFLVTSDVHFGAGDVARASVADSPEDAAEEGDDGEAPVLTDLDKHAALTQAIERLASPASAAALTERRLRHNFRGLIVTGDVTDDGRRDQWRTFLETYPAKLQPMGLAVYETAGNHDYRGTSSLRFYERPDEVAVVSAIAARNTPEQRPGLVAQSEGGSYAWKIDDVLFVNLGVKASNDARSFAEHAGNYRSTNPFQSLRFLKRVLADHGASAASIVLSFHYPIVAGAERMTNGERVALHEAIKGYPIKAIVHGHRHKTDAYSWCGVPVLEVDTPRSMRPNFDSALVAVRISSQFLVAQTIAVRKASPTSDAQISLDPSTCKLKKDGSRCWAVRRRLSAIQVERACDVGATSPLP